jgi:hypothetical protein
MNMQSAIPIKFGVKGLWATAHSKETASGRDVRRGPVEPRTNRDQGIDQAAYVGFAVIGRRGDPQPFLPARDGRIVDRLNVDVVIFEQEFTSPPAQMSVTDHRRQI